MAPEEVLLTVLAIAAILAAYAIAGTCDYRDAMRYQRAWAESEWTP